MDTLGNHCYIPMILKDPANVNNGSEKDSKYQKPQKPKIS